MDDAYIDLASDGLFFSSFPFYPIIYKSRNVNSFFEVNFLSLKMLQSIFVEIFKKVLTGYAVRRQLI